MVFLNLFLPEQERFIRVIKGEESPKHEVVKDSLKFLKEYPDIDQK